MPYIHDAGWLTMELSGAFRSGRELCPGWWWCPIRPCEGEAEARHLQALLSSTLTARGLIAPVRFSWEVAGEAS